MRSKGVNLRFQARSRVRHTPDRVLCFLCVWALHLTAIVRASRKGKCDRCRETAQIVRV